MNQPINKWIDGKTIANIMLEALTIRHQQLITTRTAWIVVIQVGDDTYSTKYITLKKHAFEKVGIIFEWRKYEANVSAEQLAEVIASLNQSPTVDGILVQLPLPNHLNEHHINELITPHKDVDGCGSYHLGTLIMQHQIPSIVSPTAQAVLSILDHYQLDLSIHHVVIVGQLSNLVNPLYNLLIGKVASLTICQANTPHLANFTLQADILIVAIDQVNFIKKQHLKANCIVIDLGINVVNQVMCGDVDAVDVYDQVQLITPVLGGIGPVIIACLVANLVTLFQQHQLLKG